MDTSVNDGTLVELPQLVREARFLPKTLDAENRTIELVWTTGSRVLRGFYDRYWEELSLDPKHVRMKRLNNGAPLLSNHDGTIQSVVGVVESARLENGKGIAVVRFAKAEDDEEAERIFRKVKDGILQNISVGYSTFKMEKVEDGKDKVPVYRATDWEPHELSIVAMGADDGAGFRALNAGDKHSCLFVTSPGEVAPAVINRTRSARKETTMDPEAPAPNPTEAVKASAARLAADMTAEDAARAATRAAANSRVEEAKSRAEAEARAAENATAAERERAAGIRQLGEQTKLGSAWAAKIIDTGCSLEQARKIAIESITTAEDSVEISSHVRVSAGEDAKDKFVRGASAWLFERTGTRKLLEAARGKLPEQFAGVSFDPGEFRGMSPIELARESLERQNVRTRGMDKMAMIGLAFTHRSAYQTTSDFAILLENVLGKVLIGAYATLPTTWERFCGTDQVPDFRTSNRYYTGAFPSLMKIAEHGEYKNAVIPDGVKRTVTTERKGLILALSREAIVNDDMGALTNMASEIGKASGRTLEEDVYAFLAENSGLGPTQSDSQPYFHANRANVGTGAALTAAAIDADAALMAYQKDPNAKAFLNLQPAILLVPRPLRGTAQNINDSQYDPDTIANKAQMKPNVVRGFFSDVIGSPYLGTATTRRYLFADPSVTPAIVVAYLEGHGRGPIMETKDGWRTDGVEWKVTLYAKVQAGDPKGAVTNAGV